MGTNKEFLSVSELKPGMIIESEIRLEGKVIIGKGVEVTNAIIEKLKDNYIVDKIAVLCAEDTIKATSNDRKTVEDVEESFNEFSSNIEEVFENIGDVKVNGIEEIRTFAKKIQTELNFTGSVVKNIVLHGSGTDALYRHCVNVSALSNILARWIGLPENEINLITYAAIFHDFGKTKIDKQLFTKVEPLTTKEIKEIKTHPIIAYDLIKEIPYLDKSVSYGVLMHHERIDGSGYPLGMKDTQIHKFARILAIADVFDAINSNRAYKKSNGPFKALEIIQKESLGKLDYEYCNIFLNHIINYYIGEKVLLNNNKVCQIIKIDLNDLARPLLLDESNFLDLKKEKDMYVEKLVV